MEELSENINLKLTSDSIDDDLIAVILQMDEELTRIFQNTDPHSQDYIDRLKDEFRFCSILDRFKHYFECRNQSQHLCSIYLCIIEHIYYKSSIESIDSLWEYISIHDTFNRARTRASLCYIYYLALHDYYHQARDLMLMCHLQDTIHLSDISTQILYNRTMVQLGLCAFRFGAMEEAHQALVDLQSGNRIKELLGQKIDRMYFLPYHMHINLQFIEWIYYISAMLIEIPWRSKYYHILMKQPILGPPESMRDHIVAASHALKIGDWKACVEFLMKEKVS
jgi:translation initiation factor 3 subunit C